MYKNFDRDNRIAYVGSQTDTIYILPTIMEDKSLEANKSPADVSS